MMVVRCSISKDKMIIDIGRQQLKMRIDRQLQYLAGVELLSLNEIDRYFDAAIESVYESLSCSKMGPAKNSQGETVFSTMHMGQYATFLYFFGRAAYEGGEIKLAEAISYVNSSLNSIFLSHRVEMPKHFYLEHPLGTIIGRAKIGDFFFCLQGCTVGGTSDEGTGQTVYPMIGEHVEMMAHSAVVGDCHIGNYVVLSYGTLVKNTDIPDNSIVFGTDRDIVIKEIPHEEMLKRMVCY